MAVDIGSQLDFLNVYGFLFFPGFVLFLLFFVFELAVIHDFADWRVGIIRDDDEVETQIRGAVESIVPGHDADLLSFGADQANFSRLYHFIDGPFVLYRRLHACMSCDQLLL